MFFAALRVDTSCRGLLGAQTRRGGGRHNLHVWWIYCGALQAASLATNSVKILRCLYARLVATVSRVNDNGVGAPPAAQGVLTGIYLRPAPRLGTVRCVYPYIRRDWWIVRKLEFLTWSGEISEVRLLRSACEITYYSHYLVVVQVVSMG